MLCVHCRDNEARRCDATSCDRVRAGEPYSYDQCRPCWLRLHPHSRLPGTGPTMQERLALASACRHRGEPTGREAGCAGCGQQHKTAPVLVCALHGECTEQPSKDRGIRDCRSCTDRAVDSYQIEVSADGLGDHLLGLTLAAGWKATNPQRKLAFLAKSHMADWVKLFGGYDELTTTPLPGATTIHDARQRGGLHYAEWVANRSGRALPALRPLSPDVRAWAESYAGCILLVPCALHAVREWPLERWLALETLLVSRGLRCVIVAGPGDQDRVAGFHSTKICGERPAKVAAMIQASACVVGNESGIAHLAGAIGTPAVVLSWLLDGPEIHGVWPKSTVIQRSTPLDITPEMVAEEIGQRSSVTIAPVTPTARFCLPTGIGDALWALHKIRHLAGDRPIEVVISGNPANPVDQRTVPFLCRFPWIRKVSVEHRPMLLDYTNPTDSKGRYRYVPDGERDGLHYLVPNKALEAGTRLEDWLPEVPIDWNVMDSFDWAGTEKGAELGHAYSPFVAFYLGPEGGCTVEGHNRGPLWQPSDWVELGIALRIRGINVIVVGAPYDRSYWETHVRPLAEKAGLHWLDTLGRFEIGETLALLRQARCLISYQCGLGIAGHYLGVPVAMWWRPDGDSAHPRRLLSFDERMAVCWTRPEQEFQDRYIGLIYGRQSAADILQEIDRRGWI